ncbi:MAG: CCA tRNA nucleotidyltransferase [Candidatus Bathyarchaeota archaeon]|nr:CCA tRNA nucleotidyltransferase [Candidatus Bathyarchaeota archaeon]
MQDKIEKLCATVLKKVTPKKAQRIKVEALAKKLEGKVAETAKALGVEAQVRIEGSVAKDTWLSEDPEIDIFMRVPTTIPRKSLGDVCLKIARKATEGSKQIERFAEHPYLEAFVEDVRVNIVPCYNVKRGEWLSATDRTPYHTDYVKKHLNVQMRGEVRLLKKFMKGIGVYGAEIKIGGFSGYLCELLILYFKSFLKTLEAFAGHIKRITIDIENYYKGRENELQLLFQEPLLIVDPVDKGRNVASAVQPQKLYTFIAAARIFLKNPSLTFFYPPETKPLTSDKLKHVLAKRGSTLIFLAFQKIDAVPDVLWGQLYKSQRSLYKLLRLNDFNILRDLSWSDEKNLSMFIFELEERILPPVKKHLGPPLEKEHECEKFLKKHLNNVNTVSGPYIEDGRWVVNIRRKYVDAVFLLSERLKDGGRSAGVAEQISQALRKGLKIFVDDEIVEVYRKNRDFAVFLTEFLSGKPKWLENAKT